MTGGSRSVQTRGIDVALVMAVAALLAIGLIMVYSTTYALGFRVYGNPNYFLIRQGMWVVVGVAALLIMMRIEYTGWQRVSVLMMAGMLLTLAVLLIFGGERFGGRRWFFGGSVQPSELAKLAVVIYIADWLSSKG
ncbi:MAG: putative lipid II flippase FtsW, partial [Chloroflexi bacterium]